MVKVIKKPLEKYQIRKYCVVHTKSSKLNRGIAVAENSDYILGLLQDRGIVSPEQVDDGWRIVEESGGEKDILDALKENGALSEEQQISILAEEFGLESIDLESYTIPPDAAELIPAKVARQYKVVPVMIRDGVLMIAMSDPSDMETLDSLRYLLNRDVEAMVAPASQIQKLLNSDFDGMAEESERL